MAPISSCESQEENDLVWESIMEKARREFDYGDRKSVYLLLGRPDRNRPTEWVYLDPHLPPKDGEYYARKAFYMKHPKSLSRLISYGCVVCDDKIYFIGGTSRDNPVSKDYSSKVFIFDAKSSLWSKGDSLNIARSSPTVISAGRKIYVFGGYMNRRYDNPDFTKKNEWAEYLDLNDAEPQWDFLPDEAPDGAFLARPQVVHFYVVYERKNLILLWFHTKTLYIGADDPEVLLFAYDYTSDKWVEPPSITKSGPISISPPVILGDTMIWHYFDKIFSYHLVTCETSLLFTIPDSPFGKPLYLGDVPEDSFLVPVGDSKLCLIWYQPSFVEPHKICCYTFKIKSNSASEAQYCDFAGIKLESSGFFPTLAYGIREAVPVSLAYH